MKGTPWLGGSSFTRGHWRWFLQAVARPRSCTERGGVLELLRVQEPTPSPSPAHPAYLSLVPVPRTATVETAGLAGAGLAGAVVVMATTGLEVTDTTNTDTAGVAGAGQAMLSAVVAASRGTATDRVEVASAGAGEAGSGGVLAACGALCDRRGLCYLGHPKAASPQVPNTQETTCLSS